MKPQVEPVSRRDQRKMEIRSAIIEAAHALFEKRGFDDVTVAEIAAKADTTVKTLFTYFRSKEDMVFEGEFDLLNGIIEAMQKRKEGSSAFKTFTSHVSELIASNKRAGALEQLDGFARMTNNPVLKSRLQMMWLAYEDAITTALASEAGAKPDDPQPRLQAAQMTALLRLLTGDEARAHIRAVSTRQSSAQSRDALAAWFKAAAKSVAR